MLLDKLRWELEILSGSEKKNKKKKKLKNKKKTILCECQTEQTMWVISFLILPSLHHCLSRTLARSCCYVEVEIKFDEFFKRNFFNYQINAVEYFSKYALRKRKMPKLKKRKTILSKSQQWLCDVRRSEE